MPSEHSQPAEPGHGAGPGYEVRDTNVRVIVVFLACLFLFMLVVQLALWGLLGAIRDEKSATFVRPDVKPVAVVDQPQRPEEFGIAEQLSQLRGYERRVLAGEEPAGKGSGKSVLPIERAIDILVERGVPPTPGPAKTEAEVVGRSGAPAPPPPPSAVTNPTGDKP
jgi:hypothetical protein